MKHEMSIKANTERKNVSKTKGIIDKHTMYSISVIYFFDFINVRYITQCFLVNKILEVTCDRREWQKTSKIMENPTRTKNRRQL